MNADNSVGLPAGYIHSLIEPDNYIYPCYARFRRESAATGAWIRGSAMEKPFDNEESAREWLLSLGCTEDRIKVCRPGEDGSYQLLLSRLSK